MNRMYTPEENWAADLLPPDTRASFDRGIRLLWRWKVYFFLVFVFMCGLGATYLIRAPRLYTARAITAVGYQVPELTTTLDRLPQETDVDGAIAMATTPDLLLAAGKQLKITVPSHVSLLVRLGLLQSTPQPADASQDQLVTYLRKHLAVQRIGHANFVSVTFTDPDPKLAADVVNAITMRGATMPFPSQMTTAERAGFNLPKIVVVSAAMVPSEPSSPNTLVVLIATIVMATCAATTVVLLRDYYASRR